mgnify:CR=1 FL=1
MPSSMRGRIPDRDDFLTYVDNGRERIETWGKAVELAAPLGEDFLELVQSGRIRDVVEKM